MTKAEKVKRIKRDWDRIAQEPVEVAITDDGEVSGYGTELATLRLYRAYEGRGRQEFKGGIKKWGYELEGTV